MKFSESVGTERFLDAVIFLMLAGQGICVALAGYPGWALLSCAALLLLGRDQIRIRKINKLKRETRVYKFRR